MSERTGINVTNQFDNSRQINLWMTSDTPEFLAIVSSLLIQIEQDLKANHNVIRFRAREHELALKHILADLFLCHHESNSKYLAYSRNKNTYSSSSRYNPKHLALGAVTNVLDSLASLNLVEQKLGFQDPKTKVSKQSRIKMKDTLVKLCQNLTPHSFYQLSGKESIILKSIKDKKGNSEKVQYDDTAETLLYRANLKLINERIASQDIRLRATDEQMEQIFEDLKDKKQSTINFTSESLARIFNNSSFVQGGRFYGAWWMSIPSKYRQLIRVNDIRTSEVDYSTMHFTMLYAEKGLEAPDGDLYQIDGIDRKKVKLALNTALNSSDEQSAISAIKQNQFPEKTKEEVKATLEVLLCKHEAIREYFYTGKGIELQFKDSQVAEDVMLEMWNNWNEIVLPVHDSFLVTRGMIGQLREQMHKSFLKVTGFSCNLDIKERDVDLMGPLEKLASRVEYDDKGNIIKLGVNAADVPSSIIFKNDK